MKQLSLIGIALALLLMTSTAKANECFPPDIKVGGVYEGKLFMFVVKDVHKCWLKAVICTSKEKCRETPYWIHSSSIEAYKAKGAL